MIRNFSKYNIKLIYIILLLFFVDYFLRVMGKSLVTQYTNLKWNWLGGVFVILFVLLWVVFKKVPSFKEIGIQCKINNKYSCMLFTAIVVAAYSLMNFIFPGDVGKAQITTEFLLFQTTMPGINEEMMFRGLLLFYCDKLFPRYFTFLYQDFYYGSFLVAFLFGLIHVFHFTKGSFVMEPIQFVPTFFLSLALSWLRYRSNSLTMPIICHNLTNTIPYAF